MNRYLNNEGQECKTGPVRRRRYWEGRGDEEGKGG
jgi:hypothetical protein